MNGFSQNAVAGKFPPGESGWLFHGHNLMLGSSLEPQSYLHIHNNADPNGSPQYAFLQITNPYTQVPSTNISPTDGLRIGIGKILTNFDAVINQQEDANLFFYTHNLQRVVIDNNGLVGIGNITPTATLDVDGSFRLRTGATNGYVLKSDAQGNASWQTLNDDDPSNEIQDISLIGTSLSITGGSTVDLSSFLDNTDAQTLSLSGQDLTISNGNTISINAINYWSKNNDVVYYNSGRVGIGTNTPHHNLQVHSTEQLSTGGGIGTGSLGGRSTVDYGAIQLTNQTTGNTENDGLLIETQSNSVNFWQQENADMTFKIGTDNRLVLKADGKVGVKNNFPNADLDVKGNFKVHYGAIINEFSTDGTLAGNSDEAIPTEQAVKTYVDNGITTIQQQITNLPGPDNLGNHTATENLKMNGYNIKFQDATKIFSITQNTWSSNGPCIEMFGKDVAITGKKGQIAFTSYGNESGNIVFNNYDGNTWNRLMTIKANGKVGIGTNNPIQTLDINGRMNLALGVIQKGGSPITSTSDLGLYSRVSGNWIRFVTNHAPIRFFSDDGAGSNANMTIEANGNVGIGTENPKELLQLGDRFVFHNGGTKVLGYNWDYDGTISKYLVNGYSSQIRFGEGGTISMVVSPYGNAENPITTELYALHINNNGNVGIGTDNPHGYKLAVNGYAIAEDFTVAEYNDWPDFVFTPKYHILSLNELDNFIQQYGHLPGIPTADDVKENGIKLGEINRKLLQKVEELTLYIIEQDKK